MISARDYCALDFMKMLGRSYSKMGLAYSIDRRVASIYINYRSKRDQAKIYAITKSIVPRISNMDVRALTVDAILSLTRTNEGDVGSILDPMGEAKKISCNFVILPDLIVIEAFKGNFSSREQTFRENEKDTGERLTHHIVGSVVISPNGIEFTPNSALTIMQSIKERGSDMDSNLLKEYVAGLREISRELKSIPEAEYYQKPIDEICKRFPRETRVLNAYNEDFKVKSTILRYALKMFLYVYTSQTTKMDYIAEGIDEGASNGKRCLPRDYIQVDALWDAEIDVINPFAVRGHFTHQPYGKGRAFRKLIYIESYMKKGYHRRATKDIVSAKGNGD